MDGLDAATTQDDASSEQDETEEEEEATLEEPNAAEIVHAGVTQDCIKLDSMPIDNRELDEAEEHLIQRFTQSGCHGVAWFKPESMLLHYHGRPLPIRTLSDAGTDA